MNAGGLDPTHPREKIGYQGIRCYVTATNPFLREEEKLNESPPGASSQYQVLWAGSITGNASHLQ